MVRHTKRKGQRAYQENLPGEDPLGRAVQKRDMKDSQRDNKFNNVFKVRITL